jgi:hypothetical protein
MMNEELARMVVDARRRELEREARMNALVREARGTGRDLPASTALHKVSRQAARAQ